MIHQALLLTKRFPAAKIIAMKLLNLLMLDFDVTREVCIVGELLVANDAGFVVSMGRRVVKRPIMLLGEDLLANFAPESILHNLTVQPEVFVFRSVAGSSRDASADFTVNFELGNKRESQSARTATNWRLDVMSSIHMNVQSFFGRVEHVGTLLVVGTRELVRV